MAEIEFIEEHDDREGMAELLPRVVRELRRQSDSLATPLRKTYRGHHMPSRDEIVAHGRAAALGDLPRLLRQP